MKKLKNPTTIDEQINKLIERDLIIDDVDFAKNFLYSVNYYNFSGYLFEFKNDVGKYGNLNFDVVYNVYMCDKRLKSILLYAIEILEHNIKTKFAYIMAHNTGNLGYRNPQNFINPNIHTKMLERFQGNVEKIKIYPL